MLSATAIAAFLAASLFLATAIAGFLFVLSAQKTAVESLESLEQQWKAWRRIADSDPAIMAAFRRDLTATDFEKFLNL